MRFMRSVGGSKRIKRFCAKETSLSVVRRCAELKSFSISY